MKVGKEAPKISQHQLVLYCHQHYLQKKKKKFNFYFMERYQLNKITIFFYLGKQCMELLDAYFLDQAATMECQLGLVQLLWHILLLELL
jgi:hypothetical protein